MEAAGQISLRDKKVLVVEDQYLIAADLGRALTKLGGSVVGPFASTEAAWDEIAKNSVDFAFLDINLDEDTVFPLADELERRGVPFVFATGHDASILPERFKSKPRLEKPFTALALVEVIRRLRPAA